jgi:hypothetical protein
VVYTRFETHDNADRVVNFHLKLADKTITGEASVEGQISKISLFQRFPPISKKS